MRKYEIILFDLDGTLSDPKIGITTSIQYGLEKMGILEKDLEKLECFIGPPLQISFADHYGFNEKQCHQAIAFYRERFIETGMYENELYEGIIPLLEKLKAAGKKLAVATSKPTVFAIEILKYFQIEDYFDVVAGSELDGTRSAKAEIIQYVLDEFQDKTKDSFVMIGDRKHDMIGANLTGIDSIGVTYGFGSSEELEHASATYIVDNIEELEKIIA
ncbi:HAD family hydrolase [Psychrobacillus sp. BL-248-WT-3]|uniref:HAD family hydrolase n=1 Tax=Psychrobacillus sp. BL-248-WT-3 TaxID=2725306 RepID=UPI00146EB3D8|nr:HAD family hydrolase [Psychrobacillus sp. BL-248-WT-3]NME06790.1 HAD family hydrolase [Psychrobacillus sp. BL-248-WT-3]